MRVHRVENRLNSLKKGLKIRPAAKNESSEAGFLQPKGHDSRIRLKNERNKGKRRAEWVMEEKFREKNNREWGF